MLAVVSHLKSQFLLHDLEIQGKRMSGQEWDDLYASAVSFSDDEQTVILISLGLLYASPDWTEDIRNEMHTACGVPHDHIMVANTHTHAAPDMYNREIKSLLRYKDLLVKRTCEAAVRSLVDLCPGQIFSGVRKMQRNMNFVRNYIKDDNVADCFVEMLNLLHKS